MEAAAVGSSSICWLTPLPLGPVVSSPPANSNRPAQELLGSEPGFLVLRRTAAAGREGGQGGRRRRQPPQELPVAVAARLQRSRTTCIKEPQ